MKNAIRVILTAVILVFFTSSAYSSNCPESDEWEIYITPYFFAPSVDFDSTVSGQTAPIDLSFSDILDDFDVFGLSTRVEAWKGRLGLIFDGSYIDLEADPRMQAGPVSIDVDVDVTDAIFDFGMAYRFDETDKLRIEPFGGLRYHYLKQEIKVNGAIGPHPIGTTLGTSYDWLEPFVGARLTLGLTDNFSFLARGDASGFGIGSASDLTWNLLGAFKYQISESVSTTMGYRYYDMDYDRGSGSSEFGFDGDEDGPIVGVTFKL